MIIARYLIKEILQALMAVLFILLMAFICQQIVRYLNYVVAGKIAANIIFTLLAFEIPYLLGLLLPLGLCLGLILALGRLYAENELSILFLSGYGILRLLRLVAGFALCISAIVTILMLWVNPYIAGKRTKLLTSDQAMVQLIQTLMPGRLKVSPDGRYVVYVKSLSRDRKRAENVFVAQERENPKGLSQKSFALVLAKEGYQTKDKETLDQLFVTEDGHRYEGVPGQNDYKIMQFKRYTLRAPKRRMEVIHPDDEMLSSRKLWQEYQNVNRAAELQWRVSISIVTFLLALLAVPLSKVRPRQGRYLALLPAILIYVIYINLLYIARHWLEQHFIPISLGLWWVHGIMGILVLGLMVTFFWRHWFLNFRIKRHLERV